MNPRGPILGSKEIDQPNNVHTGSIFQLITLKKRMFATFEDQQNNYSCASYKLIKRNKQWRRGKREKLEFWPDQPTHFLLLYGNNTHRSCPSLLFMFCFQSFKIPIEGPVLLHTHGFQACLYLEPRNIRINVVLWHFRFFLMRKLYWSLFF